MTQPTNPILISELRLRRFFAMLTVFALFAACLLGYFVFGELPKTSTGKIRKHELRGQAWAGRATLIHG